MTSPTLKTPRLMLRVFKPDDWGPLKLMLSDTAALEHMHFRSLNEVQRRQWFDECLAGGQTFSLEGMTWVIARQDTGEVIGWFGIGTTTDPQNTQDISFGYALARQHWNQGYMTEALLGVFRHEFDTLGIPQLSANCRVANIGSARAMEKAGMRRVKTEY